MANVLLSHLYKIYPGEKGREVVAVDDVNLEVADREFVVLVGPSGCGKSTTLRMIAGIEDISRGEIRIDSRVVNDVPPKDRDIAMVFQNYALYPHMSVFDNMAFALKLRRLPAGDIRRRVQEAAGILGIESLLDRRPKALSGGQRQRVALGRAIVRQPKVFLFDEPLSNLDAKMRVQMRAEIIKLHRDLKATMIYVTHDQVEAMTMGTRIVVMKDGVVQQVGAPMDIYDRPANHFVAGFLGSPPMNFLEGSVMERNGRVVFCEAGKGSVSVELTDRPDLLPRVGHQVTMGLRPEDLSLIADHAAPENTLEGTIEFIERTGAETLIHLHTGQHVVTCRTHEPCLGTSPGGRISLRIPMDKLHFFDPETGRVLCPPRTRGTGG
jgi:multiple sugar transport system ATP-binding protein